MTANSSAASFVDGIVSMVTQLDAVPPFRFAKVEDGIYRGAYPTLRNFPFLKVLGVRTILSLTPEEATYDLKEFCRLEGIRIKYISADRHKGEPQLLPNDLNESLQTLINAELHPIYMHCLDGRHVAGLVVMALRKLQCWDYVSMQLEFERYARENNNEAAFISDFSGGLVLPALLPGWLWGIAPAATSFPSSWLADNDGKLRKHPTLKLKFHQQQQQLHPQPAANAGSKPEDSGKNAGGQQPQRFLNISAATITKASYSSAPELHLWSIHPPNLISVAAVAAHTPSTSQVVLPSSVAAEPANASVPRGVPPSPVVAAPSSGSGTTAVDAPSGSVPSAQAAAVSTGGTNVPPPHSAQQSSSSLQKRHRRSASFDI